MSNQSVSRSRADRLYRTACRVRNALARIMGGRGLLLVAVMLFTASAADAQFTVSPTSFSEGVCDATGSCSANVRITITYSGNALAVASFVTKSGTAT